jgi:hypothetical protein
MSKSSSGYDDLNDDKKYLAIILGGSFLISLFTILAGNLLAGAVSGSTLSEVGEGVAALGWLWVVGTFVTGLYLQARMTQFRKQLRTVRVED